MNTSYRGLKTNISAIGASRVMDDESIAASITDSVAIVAAGTHEAVASTIVGNNSV